MLINTDPQKLLKKSVLKFTLLKIASKLKLKVLKL